MNPEVKAALERLSRIEDQSHQGLFGYSGAVFEVYGHEAEKQLYQDTALVREYLKTLEVA